MASRMTGFSIVRSGVCLGADQRKHQSSASLAFMWGIYRWPTISPHYVPVTRKMCSFDDVIMELNSLQGQPQREHRSMRSIQYLTKKEYLISSSHPNSIWTHIRDTWDILNIIFWWMALTNVIKSEFGNPFLGTLALPFDFRQALGVCAVKKLCFIFRYIVLQKSTNAGSHGYSLGLGSLTHNHLQYVSPVRSPLSHDEQARQEVKKHCESPEALWMFNGRTNMV